MIAVKISKNNEPIVTAGDESMCALSPILVITGPLGPNSIGKERPIIMRLDTSGSAEIDGGALEYLDWNTNDDLNLKVGDKICLEIVDTPVVDRPAVRKENKSKIDKRE